MKYMKITDLEPGDKIKINVDRLYLPHWNSFFVDHARKYVAIVKEAHRSFNNKTCVLVYFIDDKGSFVKEWDFDTNDSKLLEILELKND